MVKCTHTRAHEPVCTHIRARTQARIHAIPQSKDTEKE